MNPACRVAIPVLALLALSACAPHAPRPDNGNGEAERFPVPEPMHAPTESLLTVDCNANGVRDLFEVQHKQFGLLAAAHYHTGHDNPAMAPGDFDGDGDIDVAVVDAESNSISILVNDGSGTLSLEYEAAVSLDATPLRIAAGHLNADGRADLAVLYQQNAVAVFLSEGDDRPRFSLSSTHTVADHATMSGDWTNVDLVVADLDGDGRGDIAVLVTKSFHRQLVLLWNDGDGVFGTPWRSERLRPQTTNSLVAMDLDRDGDLDLVVGSSDAGAALILNSGGRALSYASRRDDLHYASSGSGLASGDLNGDGYPELMIRHAEASVSILVNTSSEGTAGFSRDEMRTLELAHRPSALAIEDLDGDGLDDVAVSEGGQVSVYLNQGDLSFERAHEFAPGMYVSQLVVAPLNARDPSDLVVTAGSGDDRIAVLVNDSRVSRDCNLNQRPDLCDIRSGRSADCNRNAVPDECDVSHRFDLSPRVFEAARAEGAFFYDPRVVLLGLDRDISPDLLVMNSWTADYTRFFLNRSDGTFRLLRNPSEVTDLHERNELRWALEDAGINFHAQSIVAASAADLTGDGRTDLAVLSLAENSIKIIRRGVNSRGEEYWSSDAEEVHVAGTPLRHVEAVDLDADGDVDLVAAPSDGLASVVLLRNGGSGDFSSDATWNVAVTEAPSSIAVTDLDRDGLPELVMSRYVAGTVTVCKNLSTAERLRFGLCTGFAAGPGPIAVRIGDLDGNGYPDVVVANDFTDHVSVLMNSPRRGAYRIGQWPRRLAAPVAVRVQNAPRAYPKDVAVADLDADGDLDIATANWGTDRVSILRNAGDGTFLRALVFAAGFRPESIQVGDLDSDSRPDIATANGNGDITVLLNRSQPAYSRDSDFNARPDECAP